MTNLLACLRTIINTPDFPDGETRMASAYVAVHRYRQDTALTPDTHAAFAYLVIDGAVRITLPTGVVEYSPGQYFVSSLIKGVAAHVMAVAENVRHRALRFDFHTEDVVSVLRDMDAECTLDILGKPTVIQPNADENIEFMELAIRIAKASKQSIASAFLQTHFKRELIYRIIGGAYGKSLIQDILNIHNAKDIYATNDWIKDNYKSAFAVDALAEKIDMSVSSFHRKFKAAIGMGSLQCQKQLRLMEARRLLLDEHYRVTDVAWEVGYESLSQFIRDYKKRFGLSPQKDIQRLHNQAIS